MARRRSKKRGARSRAFHNANRLAIYAVLRTRVFSACEDAAWMIREANFHAMAGKASKRDTTISRPTSGRLDPALIPDVPQQLNNLAIARLNAHAARSAAGKLWVKLEDCAV